MGYFTDIHNSGYAAENVAQWNRANGNSNHTILGYTLATNAPKIFSVFGSLLTKSEDGAGNNNGNTDTEIKALENEKEQLMSEIGCKSTDKFDSKLNDINAKITSANDSIIKLQGKLDTLQSTPVEPDGETNTETKKANIESQIKAKESELKAAQDEYNKAQKNMAKIVEIDKKIASIKEGRTEEKTKELKNFTKALKAWQNADESQKSSLAQNVIIAYESMKDPPKSVQNLYTIYDQDLNYDVNGKRENLK